MRRITAVLLLITLVVLPGCSLADPVVVSREALGTVVSVTAYGEDESAVRAAIDDSFTVMAEIAGPLDAYTSGSDTAAFNRQPYTAGPLPPRAADILDEIEALEVGDAFSPTLFAVTRLYDFEGARTLPDTDDLALAVTASDRFVRQEDGTALFSRLMDTDVRLEPDGPLAPGLDLGGAAKGLALDAARESLRGSDAVTAALISSGSSTVTLGTKPDGGVWRIGIEDPRDLSRVLAVFSFEGDGALSTSGDYQRYFEVDGERYHHILDPTTGLPARGVRSLTIAGASLSGLDSDILSTALFVRGAHNALAYAAEHGAALMVVDAEGRTLVVPAPENSGVTVSEEAPETQ
ncbi:MAG: FAD:protein FMN transferase [Coriobacteriia bacterium]|nr:FAD:protein FMN transferase [Coriobacteriia bacterium]